MKSTVLNEINNMKYLFNYDRSKTINEQQETPVPTPPATGSTVGSGPIPAPADGESSRPLPPPVTPQDKFEDDGTTQKYYYAKKGQENWKQSTNPKSVEAIKKNIFKIR